MASPARGPRVYTSLIAIALAVIPFTLATLLVLASGAEPSLILTGISFIVWATAIALILVAVDTSRARRAQRLAPPEDYAHNLHEVTRSRREIVHAFEIERRRIERDLHDGAQQHIVAASMQVGEAALLLDGVRDSLTSLASQPSPPTDSTGTHAGTSTPGGSAVGPSDVLTGIREKLDDVAGLLSTAQDTTDEALATLRRTVAGIHPKVLSDMGLEAAVRDISSRSGLNVTVRAPHPLPHMPEGVVAAAYFLVSEALTNVAKYAPDAEVSVLLAADNFLHVTIVDNGPGGAALIPGHGLMGMRERLLAFGGDLELSSPAGGPTTLATRLPLLLLEGESSVVMPMTGSEGNNR